MCQAGHRSIFWVSEWVCLYYRIFIAAPQGGPTSKKLPQNCPAPQPRRSPPALPIQNCCATRSLQLGPLSRKSNQEHAAQWQKLVWRASGARSDIAGRTTFSRSLNSRPPSTHPTFNHPLKPVPLNPTLKARWSSLASFRARRGAARPPRQWGPWSLESLAQATSACLTPWRLWHTVRWPSVPCRKWPKVWPVGGDPHSLLGSVTRGWGKSGCSEAESGGRRREHPPALRFQMSGKGRARPWSQNPDLTGGVEAGTPDAARGASASHPERCHSNPRRRAGLP
jgi:hypothetical protein